MAIIAMTTSHSIKVKPLLCRVFISADWQSREPPISPFPERRVGSNLDQHEYKYFGLDCFTLHII